MKLEIAKKDLFDLRDAITHSYRVISGYGTNKSCKLTIKMVKKLNYAIKNVYGHDCNGDDYLDCVKGNIKKS